MLINVLKSKITYAKLTDKSLFYEGSITIDADILEAAKIIPNEQVQVVNLNNGDRLVTYAIPGKRGSKEICLNGAAARCGEVGDNLFILTYAEIDPAKETMVPTIINLKENDETK